MKRKPGNSVFYFSAAWDSDLGHVHGGGNDECCLLFLPIFLLVGAFIAVSAIHHETLGRRLPDTRTPDYKERIEAAYEKFHNIDAADVRANFIESFNAVIANTDPYSDTSQDLKSILSSNIITNVVKWNALSAVLETLKNHSDVTNWSGRRTMINLISFITDFETNQVLSFK